MAITLKNPHLIRMLAGITTSGTPHLGNYLGAIKPAIAASVKPNTESFYFLADYHALIKAHDPQKIQQSTLEIAASWLACGLDVEKVYFYRQSDIAEIAELTWFLTCVTSKGWLNRAHAYKAAVDKNVQQRQEVDADITAGLYMYPVLMAADILMFNAHKVPVGRDQVQHIEMARDIAQSFNHHYGRGKAYFTLPEAVIDEEVATLPGLDGRKMSKSYDNVIPLFAKENELKQRIAMIVTDSKMPGEPKNAENSVVYALYEAFSTHDEAKSFKYALEVDGIAWGAAKEQLFHVINKEISPVRERYEVLISYPEKIEAQLQAGAAKARVLSAELMRQLRSLVGIQSLSQKMKPELKNDAKIPNNPLGITFKQYRESDGLFYFKLLDDKNRLVVSSLGFEQAKEVGRCIKDIQEKGRKVVIDLEKEGKLSYLNLELLESVGGFEGA